MTRWLLPCIHTLFILLLFGCGGGNGGSVPGTNEPGQTDPGANEPGQTDPEPTDSEPTDSEPTDNGDPPTPVRDYRLKLPDTHDEKVPAPLVLLLHGYSGSGDNVSSYFRMDAASDQYGFVLAVPQGERDSNGARYWNATDACCAFDENVSDDVAYLESVIEHVSAAHSIDPRRIYVAGHSNGGFMAHRLACELSSTIAGAVSVAGASWKHPEQCGAEEPVSVLQIHGDMDDIIFLGGGVIEGDQYPSAFETVTDWADRNGCTGELVDAELNIDLVAQIDGAETRVQAFDDCPAGGAVSLWTIYGAGHVPQFNEDWFNPVWEFLAAHPKP